MGGGQTRASCSGCSGCSDPNLHPNPNPESNPTIQDAMNGWGTNKGQLLRLLGGLDDVFAVVGAVVGAIARAVGGLAAVAVVITAGRSHKGEAQQYSEKSQ